MFSPGSDAPDLLTRDQFRGAVFARDGGRCVICKRTAVDAHHVVERRLWSDGGYYPENGVSLCEEHHLAAEATGLSCEEVRAAAGIEHVVLPEHLAADQRYDKWGNPILDNGQRLRGELFDDESVQKVLAPVLHLFTTRVKYPRTFHLPWSPGLTNDDRVMANPEQYFNGKEVVVTVKSDGENTTMYRDYLHARSLEYAPHPSRSWVKALHGRMGYDIPEGWRVCGENVYAKHSIHYHNLRDWFLVFSLWNERNVCLSWDDTVEWAAMLGLTMVPMLWRGVWADEEQVRGLYQPTFEGDPCEGYVVRLAGSFHYREFRRSAAKYVRKGHVATQAFWMQQKMEVNGLERDHRSGATA